jgi:transposase
MTGRPLAPLELSVAEEEALRSLAGRRTTAQALALRARIVLSCATGQRNQDVAAKLGVTPQTVGKWRARFVSRRLDGLHDEPRPGVPRSIDDARVEAVIVATLETMPADATHWSSRAMARASGISTSSVQRIWRAFGLQPHRAETFKLSNDPLFIDKVRDIVGLYMSPPDHALVLCVDEKSQIQALDRTQPLLPLRPGIGRRRTGRLAPFAGPDVDTVMFAVGSRESDEAKLYLVPIDEAERTYREAFRGWQEAHPETTDNRTWVLRFEHGLHDKWGRTRVRNRLVPAKYLLLWCPWPDSNQHGLAANRF